MKQNLKVNDSKNKLPIDEKLIGGTTLDPLPDLFQLHDTFNPGQHHLINHVTEPGSMICRINYYIP